MERITKWLTKEDEAFLTEIKEQINRDNPKTAYLFRKREKLALFCKRGYLRKCYREVTYSIHYTKTKKRFLED